jgi:hypothetical protein
MTITIQSIQVGGLITEGDPQQTGVMERQWTTGFYKRPVTGNVRLGRLNVSRDSSGLTPIGRWREPTT